MTVAVPGAQAQAQDITPDRATASANDGNSPNNAIDGRVATRWSAKGNGQTITFDLGARHELTAVKIGFYKGDRRSAQFALEHSADGQTWSPLSPRTSSSGQTTALETFSFSSVRTRYVRFVGFGNSSNDWNSLTEFQAVGQPVPAPQLFGRDVVAIASASSNVAAPNDAANAFDSDLATRWSSGTRGNPVTFDLGGVQTVDAVAIAHHRGNTAEQFGYELFAGSARDAQFVRYVGQGNSENRWSSVLEFRALSSGQAAPTATPVPPTATPVPPTPTPAPTGNGLDPAAPPSTNFDLSQWYVSVPIDEDGNGRADNIYENELNAGYINPEFFFTAPDGGMVFRSPNAGIRTSTNTKYVRTELREMLRAGNTSISTKGVNGNNWVFGSTTSEAQRNAGGVDGDLFATLKVDHVTTTGDASQVGRVIIGQIHANDDEPIRLYYRKLPGNERGSIYFAHENRIAGTDDYYEMIGSRGKSAANPTDGIALGEVFSYRIQVEGNQLIVTISRDGMSDLVERVDMTGSGYDGPGQYMYFKAGVYNQNNSGDADDYVQATFYALENTHS